MQGPVVLATRSAGKLRELRAMFGAEGFALEDLAMAGLAAEDPAEDGLEVFGTFEENARAKARWFAARLPGRTIVADDSGLEVAALGGAPGVRSKRWSGSAATGLALDAENNAALLRALHGRATRDARYVSVVVCVDGAREWVARGECTGRILDAPVGAGGFGYDPYFLSDDLGTTFGAASAEAKARVSHRGRAFRALLSQWRADASGGKDAVKVAEKDAVSGR